MLALAWRDNPDDVREFVEDRGYRVPIAIANEGLTRELRVVGVPTRCLASPDGRVLQIASGDDWRALLRAYAGM